MTRVITSEDCGNSPKNILLEKLTIALADGDPEFTLSSVTDDIRWTRVGNELIEGKVEFAEALEQATSDKAVVITIHHVATHGKVGAVNGTSKLKSGKTLAFCNVYVFSGAKGTSVKEITSYVIETR
jgi:hypothetical protein